MASTSQVALTVTVAPQGSALGGTGTISASDASPTTSFADVRQREAFALSTLGSVGAAWTTLDTPAQIRQLLLQSRSGTEFAIRLNGAVASVKGSGATFGTITNTDTFTLTVDGGSPTAVNFATGDTTIALVIARINAALGLNVASNDGSGNLVLSGARTGGAVASALGHTYGQIVLATSATLAKLGLNAGTTLGAGVDIGAMSRFFCDFPSSGARIVTKVELSGSADMITHAAG
jgi:hypothetical protein